MNYSLLSYLCPICAADVSFRFFSCPISIKQQFISLYSYQLP